VPFFLRYRVRLSRDDGVKRAQTWGVPHGHVPICIIPQINPSCWPRLPRKGTMTEDKLFLTFMPSLVSVLLRLEKAKGSPLTENEVLEIRNNAMVVALPEKGALAVAEQRGYQDIDPVHCWEQWQKARVDLIDTDLE